MALGGAHTLRKLLLLRPLIWTGLSATLTHRLLGSATVATGAAGAASEA